MKIMKKTTEAIAKLAEIVCMSMVAGMVIMIVAELINRNVFDGSFRATIEICGIFFLWMAFIGLIPLYCRNGLMRLDFLVARTRGALEQILYLLNKLVSLVLGVVMVIAFVAQYPFVSTRYYATILWLPYTVQYVPMAIAGAYIALKTVEQLIEWVLELRGKHSESEEGYPT